MEEYYLDSGNCINCLATLDGCLKCSSASVCLSCVKNTHYLAANSTCLLCGIQEANCL